MTDEGTPPPRRGLPPTDVDTPDEGLETTVGRRWRYDFTEATSPATAVPPIAVLPGDGPARSGRRFASDDLPADWEPPLPRHSAISPSDFDTEPEPGHALVGQHATSRRRFPAWLWALVVVLVAAAVFAAWFLLDKPGTAVVPTPSPSAQASLLSEPSELSGLLAGSTWTATNDYAPDESKGIVCINPSSQLALPPTSVVRRTLTAAGAEPATVIEQVETYRSVGAATQSYAARAAQLGGCTGVPALPSQGYKINGLGDQSIGIQALEQIATPVTHVVLAVRSGSSIVITDAAQTAGPFAVDAVAKAISPSLTRACTAASGACPGTLTVEDTDVPAGDPAGWLTPGDLPRVTLGAGVWVGAELKPMKLAGSSCEGDVDLTNPAKSVTRAQRGFVLSDDPKASAHFGLDEASYTFDTDADAKAFADGVVASITGCAKRTGTATVAALGTVQAPATGQLFTVDQRMNIDRAARYRVGVAAIGTRVVYFAANPTGSFDLTDEQWLTVLERAVARVQQSA